MTSTKVKVLLDEFKIKNDKKHEMVSVIIFYNYCAWFFTNGNTISYSGAI